MRNFSKFLADRQTFKLIEALDPVIYDTDFNPVEFFEDLFEFIMPFARNSNEKFDVLILKEDVFSLLREFPEGGLSGWAGRAAAGVGNAVSSFRQNYSQTRQQNQQQPQQQQIPQNKSPLTGDTHDILWHLAQRDDVPPQLKTAINTYLQTKIGGQSQQNTQNTPPVPSQNTQTSPPSP